MNQAVVSSCLSTWRLGQIARQEVTMEAADRDHLAHCARCRTMLHDHEEGQRSAVGRPVPALLLNHLRRKQAERRRRRWAQGSSAATALMAACLAWVLIPHGALLTSESLRTQTKGSADLLVTALRDDTYIMEETPLMAATGLRSGDRLRLRVIADDDNGYVELESADGTGRWDMLYSGDLPNDHWLPVGVRLDGTSQTVLRLRVCPDAQQRELCVEQIFKF